MWKIYRSIVSNAGNHAKIFGPKIIILRFAFELHVAQKGLGLTWQELAAASLWNSRLLTVSEKSITCKFLIRRGVLRLSDVVDTSA